MLEGLVSALAVLFLLGGCTIATIGVYGLIVKPDLFDQLHVAGLVTGPGVILVLLASLGTGSAETATSAVLVIAFVLVTSSISTHVIAQAGVRRYGPGPADARRSPAGGRATSSVAAADGTAASPRPARTGMRVVAALDGSPGSRVAAELARSIDWPAGTTVRLLTVGEADPAAGGELAAVAEALESGGVRVESAVLAGDPADVIVHETAAFEADLLITGSRRRGFVASLLGLSATGEIVDRAPCPVLVARTPTIRDVILTTDGSTQSAAAAEVVARWPIFDLARIRVVTVSAETPSAGARDGSRAADPAAQRIADAAAGRLMDAGRDVVTEVLHGSPADRIVETAAHRSIDLIVIGSRGRTGLGRTLLGSVAGEVLASAGCSVLIVGPPPRRPGGAS
jgi:monovalent cation/proton antiporter MnhG/PhaG subunit